MADEDDVDIMPLELLIMVLLMVGPGACDHDTTRAFNFNAGSQRKDLAVCSASRLLCFVNLFFVGLQWLPNQKAGSCGLGLMRTLVTMVMIVQWWWRFDFVGFESTK